MPRSDLTRILDPNHPEYAYTATPITEIWSARGTDAAHPDSPKGGSLRARLFLGEWVKIIEKDGVIPEHGRIKVAYRGGTGYVHRDDLTRRRHLEMYFIDVEQGDAILIQTPDDRRILIDGGAGPQAHQFIANKYGLDKDDQHFIDFEAIVATHSDEDHTAGLIPILKDKRIAVKRIFHNGLFRRAPLGDDAPGPHDDGYVQGLSDHPGLPGDPELTSLMKKLVGAFDAARANLPGVLAKMREQPRWAGRVDFDPDRFVCRRIDAVDGHLPPYDDPDGELKIEVLWPWAEKKDGQLVYPWYGDPGKTVNGNSVVLRVRHGDNTVLLTGDLNDQAMDDVLIQYPASSGVLRADVYKAAHHGSQYFSLDFMRAVRPNAAVISSGDDMNDRYGHPRAVLIGSIVRNSRTRKPAVFSTELAACFRMLTTKELKNWREGKGRLYEKSLQGIVHLRSNGEDLCLGTVHGRRPPATDVTAQTDYKWDVWPA